MRTENQTGSSFSGEKPDPVWFFGRVAARAVTIILALVTGADAQDYRGKFTASVYAADHHVTTDLNVRYSSRHVTGWIGWYGPQSDVHQSRMGVEYDLKRSWLTLVPSAQLASRSFVGGSVYSEIGTRWYLVAGASRTNLKPYANLTFDPNESWQLGGGLHYGNTDSVAVFTIWDNRLDTGQQNSHLVIRHYLPHAERLTLDLSYKSGHGNTGEFVRGSAEAVEYDWHRWFVKLARDAQVNFTPQTMWRTGAGIRF